MFGRGIVFFSENKSKAGGGFSLSGGTETTVGSDKVLTFTTNGTLTVNGSGTIKLLIVGGGAGGGGGRTGVSNSGAGGGGGEVLYYASYSVSAGSYAVVVGAQTSGRSGNTENINNPGKLSSIFGITARGGDNANSWGAYGGGSRTNYSYGSGFDGQVGTSNDITGTSVVYASGAGGGANGGGQTFLGGSGGTGAGRGGGVSGNILTPAPTDGTNYGAGGGGGGCIWNYNQAGDGRTGQQGVVIIRYTPN